MKKRYQIFISSTFADLRDERNMVMQAVLERKCFPAGMELFPAIDKEQFDYIKKVIDDTGKPYRITFSHRYEFFYILCQKLFEDLYHFHHTRT